ncbi:T9SS type A sorting domain-containing protein [Ferruginibacter lapsinanis]|uniref:SdrD B-like domain-containing protein n=1 Tax=Ferruginibacter lapsinanis TaxID=563172 RepID=UPI001E3BE74B|nr:SdrD B-like domain-containing protein [Ferruginibacter lapsinanis]UEG49509.1 T9SS type A sorting domain-containing protein [Ferruginibacter lapsinanis]
MKVSTNCNEQTNTNAFYRLCKKFYSNIKVAVLLFSFAAIAAMGANAQQPAPSCNLTGPLKACLNGGNFVITANIDFSTANPQLVYSFPTNTAGAFIVSTGPFIYDPLNDAGTQQITINPGVTTGQINLQLDVTTVGGTCECSKSITIVNVSVNTSYTPIVCYGGTSTLTATATGFGSASYKFTLNPGNVVVGPQLSPIANFPNLPAGIYTVTVLDNNGCTAQSIKEITQPPLNPVVPNCPINVVMPICATQQQIDQAFSDWLNSFSFSGGTNASSSRSPLNPTAPPLCGGTTEVTWTITSTCEPPVVCTRTFTVQASPPLVVNCPPPVNLPACTSAADILIAYNAWKAGFSVSGGCSPTSNIANIPALTDLTCGGTLNFTLMADNAPNTCPSHKECGSSFTVAAPPPLVVNCPPPVNLPACTSATDILVAYNAWKAGFSVSGGCSPTSNIANIPALTNLTCGGTLNFTLIADNAPNTCPSHKECGSSFTVAAPPPLVVNCPPPVNLPACTSAVDILAAYNIWKAGFSVSGGCSPTSNIANIPALTNLTCGGTLNFTLIADNGAGYCVSHKECGSSFTVAAPPPLVVNCPPPVNLPACTSAADILVAYNAWKAGFSVSGGCSPTSNIANIPALTDLTCGGTLNFTLIADNGAGYCVSHKECGSSFAVAAPPPLVVNCPPPVNLPACTNAAAILAAYNIWKAGFSVSGGCSPTSNIANIPALPDLTCGGTFNFTLIADNAPNTCPSHKECGSSFTVAAPPPLVVNCPPPVNLPACTSAADILTAYNAWKAGFSVSGGCSPISNIANIPGLSDLTCGGTLNFTLIADNAPGTCISHKECGSSFTVAAPPPLVVNCPPPVNLPACTSAADILIAYNAWKAGFSVSGGCSPTSNIANIPALPNLTCGGTFNFTLIADNAPGTCPSHKECGSSFTVAAPPPLVVNCPPPVNLPACTNAADILTAYNAWKAGFSVSGGCSPISNIANIPGLSDLTCGGTINFTLIADNAPGTCISHKECGSSFTVAAPPPLVVNCPPPVNLPACTNAADILTAYNAWKAGFSVSGGCSPTSNIANIPALPNLTCGGTFNFTLMADNGAGYCVSHKECGSSFTVAAPPPLVVNCPPPVNLPACTNAVDILTAYNAWKAGFSVSGGCSPISNIANIPGLSDLTCGGTINFTLIADNAPGTCISHKECGSSFTVAAPPPLVVNCPPPVNLPACTSAADILTAYNAWKAGFSVSGGCSPTSNIANIPGLPDLTCGGSINFTLIADNAPGTCISHKECGSSFSVAVPPVLVVNCPAPVNLPACTSPADILTAYNAWKAGFSVSGGCSPTSNLGDIPNLGNIACGGTINFTLMANNGQGYCVSHKECGSSFSVAQAPPVTLTCPQNVIEAGGQSQAVIDQLYADWLKTVVFGGGCNAQLSDDSPGAPNACGGVSTVTFTVKSNCEVDKKCTATFTVTSCVNLGDFVWYDKDNDGVQEAGEPGINNVTVNLYTDNNSDNIPDGPAITSTTTNASGKYSFSGLPEGKYIVGVVTPTGYAVGATTATSTDPNNDNNTDNNGVNVVGTEVFSNYVTLTAGGEPTTDGDGANGNLTVDFGFDLGSIGDFVWQDTNGDGLQDVGEPGIPGVTVELYTSVGGSPGSLIGSTTTDGTGHYLFPDLPAGTYCVKFINSSTPSPDNQGSDNMDSDPINGIVCDIVLTPGEDDLTIDAGFTKQEICYESCTGNGAVGAIQTIDNGNGTVTIRTTFAKTFVDNTYGTNAIGWPGGHTFNQLVGSDHLQLAIYDVNDVKKMEFKLDYITAAAVPSGYKNLGVTGGEGSMLLGSASDIVSTMTSIDVNLNTYGYVLTTNSPATNASYTPNPSYPNWIYDVWYEVTVKKSAFPAGFGYPLIAAIHASPSKTGNNTECVQPCQPLTVEALGSDGPCNTVCKGSISVTASHGKAPYTYTWSDGPSTDQNRFNLCPGSYTVTVHDNNGGAASATVVINPSPSVCPPEICYESCTGNSSVGAIQTVDNGNGTTTIRTTFAKTFVDNTYGTNAIGWPNGHTFSNLVGSDHLQLALYDGNNVKKMEFKLDYITAAAVPSGYKNLGVTGGEGSMLLGSASDVVSTMTSLDVNFNTYGYVLTTNSPATNAAYAPNPTYPNWIYDVWYEVTVKNSAFGAAGFGKPLIAAIHASPSKTGNNTECVQPCQPLAVAAVGSNGPCNSVCKGSITVTPSHGKAPYSFTWSDGPSTAQNRSNLCPGTYTVTVQDALGATASSTVVIVPAQTGACDICYASCTGKTAVGAKQTITDNGNGTTTIRTTFAKTFVDNTYGTNAIGWPGKGHKFKDLVGSDHLQLALYDANNVKKMEFKIDYISAAAVPSGYKTLGVTGGEGKMLLGSASDVVGALTSLDVNLNTYGYVLITNSPATNAAYAPNATYPNWIYDVWYEVTVKNSAFGPAGFGKPMITSVHASPSKTGSNSECVVVAPCPPVIISSRPINNSIPTTKVVDMKMERQFEVYPNPASNTVNMSFVPDNTGNSTVSLYNVDGKLVSTIYSETTLSGKMYFKKFSISHLLPGVYLIKLQNGKFTQTKKLTIVR